MWSEVRLRLLLDQLKHAAIVQGPGAWDSAVAQVVEQRKAFLVERLRRINAERETTTAAAAGGGGAGAGAGTAAAPNGASSSSDS